MKLQLPILPASLLLVAACAEPQPSPAPDPAETRPGRWQQDVRYVCDNVARMHPNAFRRCSREDFESATEELVAEVPSLRDQAIVVGIARVIALLQDGHTTIPFGGTPFPFLPFEIAPMSDGYFLIAAPEEHADALGGKLLSVGGVPVDEAIERIGAVFSHENEFALRARAPRYLRQPDVLHAIGLTDSTSTVELEFETQVGRATSLFGPSPEETRLKRSIVPLADTRHGENYWHATLPESGAVYWQYNVCYEDPKRPFANFADELLRDLEDPKVRRLIIDLRWNGGGDERVVGPVYRALQGHRLDVPGGLIVLIGGKTFSSAKGLAMNLRNETAATLMGTPLSQRENTYGQIKLFKSPNFGVVVSYSTRYFPRGSDDVNAVMPDVLIPVVFDDWRNGVDRTLEAALAYSPD